jgi:signal transduction histidine kinase
LQNLPRHFADPAFREDALRGLGKSVSRMQQLIGQLTLLRQKLEIRPVLSDLNEVVAASLESLPNGEALPLARQLQPVPKTMLDPEQMQKVILNLLLNAKEALNGPDGRISLETVAHPDGVEIAVADNGCGMAPEFLHRHLFRPFQTTKKNGTGIGMFHSKMIVEAHRGRFEVASEPGKGSKFRIFLPIIEK